ncbi:MAG: AsmA family protein [Desulfobulbaceae bacterium]|nr:AsmA family protein [Desulfobulbaceae bacterium]HIJ77719.1 AsmA family protein [Deltaproteobacteria bacterium]
MKKSLKIFIVLIAIITITVLALAALVRFYLTDERIKALIIPPAEQALARKVTVGAIKVSLLSGITVHDFSVKEADGANDFIKTKAFVLRYQLLPLIHKEVVISEITLLDPAVNVHRDHDGRFNFESIGLATAPEKTDRPKTPTASQAAALPLALTVNNIQVKGLKITVTDAKKELPQITTLASLTVALDIKNLQNILYNGSLKFTTDVVYGKVTPHLSGSCTFDQQQLAVKADITADTEQLHLDGSINDYLTAPDIRLDFTSKKLNIDQLLAIVAGLPKAAQQVQQADSKGTSSQEPLARALPQGLVLSGKIKVDEVLYDKLTINDLHLVYGLKNGIFNISKMDSRIAGGTVQATGVEADLNLPAVSYHGKAEVAGLEIGEILKALKPQASEVVNGTAATTINFSGAGTQLAEIKKNLAVDAVYSLADGAIKNHEITKTVAALVGLQELNNLSFEKIDGNVKVHNGKALISSQMNGPELKLNSKGTVSLDGELNLPVTIILSQALSDKLKQRASIAGYLANEQGETSLRLTILGTVDKPRPTLDQAAIKKQAEKAIKNKLLNELDKAIIGKDEGGQPAEQEKNQAKDLLKGLLGF